MSAHVQPTGGVAATVAPVPPKHSSPQPSLPQPNPSTTTAACAYCKAEGANNYCAGCSLCYCNKECQRKDWKKHKKLCMKLQEMRRASQIPQQSEDAVAPGGGEGGGGGGAAAAAVDGRSSTIADEEDEIENPCPICLDNEDDATVDGAQRGMCSACGQSYCGACKADGLADRSPNCPTCRAPLVVSDEEEFKRLWKLEHDRSPGRHTAVAQSNLGCLYLNGKGVEQDHVEAAKWFQKAAEAGNAMAQFNLGILYHTGKGVEQDHVEAAKWYRKAAKAGLTEAQHNLGIMHAHGKGVEQDHVEAVTWSRKAAEAGLTEAQHNLGAMYRYGEGVEQDHVEAAKWYRKAAEAGYAMAQYNLALMHAKGQGVEQDFCEALTWMQLAAEQGYENSLKALDALQQHNLIPTPPPSTAVTTILLTSAKAVKYNNKTGRVIAPTEGAAIKPGRAIVLLDGDSAPISFKLKNLKLV
eukprot:gene11824-biopygen25110